MAEVYRGRICIYIHRGRLIEGEMHDLKLQMSDSVVQGESVLKVIGTKAKVNFNTGASNISRSKIEEALFFDEEIQI